MRVEPVLHKRRPALLLDLYLAGAAGHTVIPLVLAYPAAIVERMRDPLLWPHGTALDDAAALALAERVLPHLERLVLAAEPIVEHVVRFRAAPAFEAARAAGCLGAAPLRDALLRLAPYRYARRFVRGRTVRIDAADAVAGWALLRDAATVGVVAPEREPAAAAWFGEPPRAPERAEVAIVGPAAGPGAASIVIRLDPAAEAEHRVGAVDPVPLDVDIVFDPAEAPVRRWFAVERAPEPVRRARAALPRGAAGGSAGRIAVVLGRSDAAALPDADADEARALVELLAAEGFDARLVEPEALPGGSNLIHLVGTREGRRARAVVEAGRRAGIPVVVHAHDEDARGGGWWGAAVTRFCFEFADDERDQNRYLAMLAARAVSVGEAVADRPYAPAAAADDDADAALREAALVFAATEEEAQGLRVRTGRRGPIEVVPPLAAAAEAAPIGHLVGPDPFVLIHAPIGPLANQLPAAHAAALASVPLVLAGPVADAAYLEAVRAVGGLGLVVLSGEPRPELAAALRSAAAIVLDAAWIGAGGARLAAAALAGTRLVLADRRRFAPPGAEPRRFDAASVEALTRALGEAWDETQRAPAPLDPRVIAGLAPSAALRAIVRGYAGLAGA